MIIVLKPNVSKDEIDHIMDKIKSLNLEPHLSQGEATSIIGVIGDENKLREQPIEAIDGVDRVMPVMKPYKRASLEFSASRTVVDVNGVKIGGKHVPIIAGPCSVESEENVVRIAREIKEAGASMLRGGAFKPRTSPYSFQGLEEEGLKILAAARAETGLPIVTELMDVRHFELVESYTDVIQIGARNSQNFPLLKEVGKTKKAVLLKRGISGTLEELLMSAEYILNAGNPNVILCERGIRTFETASRNTLDINAVPILKSLTHLPIVIDPSHAVGKRAFVPELCMASVAAGADGLLLETHFDPEEAMTDGAQTIANSKLSEIMPTLKKIAEAVGREM